MTDLEWLRSEFERCWPWLEPAIARYGPTHDKDHIWLALEQGDAQLWPSPNAAALTELKNYKTGFKEVNGWLSGGDLEEIRRTTEKIEDWARRQGCRRATICGREGWLRAFDGYVKRAVVMTKEL